MSGRKRTAVSRKDNNFFSPLRIFSSEEKRLKGQWYIISAVVVSSVFFGISVLLKDYFVIDASQQAAIDNDYHFYNIVEQFDRIVATTPTNVSCFNLTTNLNEFKSMIERSLAARGYFVNMEYSVSTPCGSQNTARLDLLIADNEQIIYNFSTYTSPRQILGAK